MRPDILHINNGGYPGAASCRIAVLSARCAGIHHIVFTVNNLAFPRNTPCASISDALIKRYVSCFTTASLAARDALVQRRRFDAARIQAIPNTIRNADKLATVSACLRHEFSLDAQNIVICSAGLLTQRKGYDVLIDAVGQFQDAFRQQRVRIFVFGEGEERPALEARIRSSRLEDLVFLPGHRPNVIPYLADADIFVLPSRANEDMPYAILEAMVLGKPVVATRVAGIPTEVDHQTSGLLVAPDNCRELGEALHLLVCNRETRRQYGFAGQQRYQRLFGYNTIMAHYRNLYDALLT